MKQYLDLMRHIFENGNNKGDRTGTGTRSVFGAQMRFSLRDNAIPLLTSKKVFVRGLIEELLWFLRGSTNNEELVAKNVHIWDGWALEEDVKTERRLEGYELAAKYAEVKKITLSDAQGRLQIKSNLEGMDAAIKMLVDEGVALTEEKITHLKGDLGPIYGAQWRNWRTPEGTQIDQIAEMIDLLRTKPNSRRMVVTAWNPADLPDESISPQDNVKRGRMALAACHCLFQLYTRPLSFEERTDIAARRGLMLMSEDGAEEIFDAENIPKYALSCQLYQRSADYFLGVPFNIASYAILTAMIAQVVNMVPEEFIWTGGDVHLYNNHFEQVAEQLSREPLPGPTLHLNPDVRTLEDFTVDDFEIRDYKPHATIKAPVSV